MKSTSIKSSITTVISKAEYTVHFSLQYPEIESPSELSQIFPPEELISILNLTSKLSLEELATKLARTFARQDSSTLLTTCYALFSAFPLSIQQAAIATYTANPAILLLFSFSSTSTPPATKRLPGRPSTKPPSPALNLIAAQLAEAKAKLLEG